LSAYGRPRRNTVTKAPSTPSRRSLKITLKLPNKSPRGRRARVVDSTDPSEPPSRDANSEDDDDAPLEDDDGEEEVEEDEGEEEVMPSTSSRNLTARQAVLASVVDSSHVSLDGILILARPLLVSDLQTTDSAGRKKKQLNEAELALRREETARKRKHMSEKKLEDEKVNLCDFIHVQRHD
jgi:Ino eighty subunit 2